MSNSITSGSSSPNASSTSSNDEDAMKENHAPVHVATGDDGDDSGEFTPERSEEPEDEQEQEEEQMEMDQQDDLPPRLIRRSQSTESSRQGDADDEEDVGDEEEGNHRIHDEDEDEDDFMMDTNDDVGEGDDDDDDDEERIERIPGPNLEAVEHIFPFSNPLSTRGNNIRTGAEFQTDLPEIQPDSDRENEQSREIVIWENPCDVDDEQLEDYVSEAVTRYHLSIDRALYILTKEKFDFEKAINQCASRRVFGDDWKPQEKELFTTCLFTFGKQFKKIQKAIPHRNISSIVRYYYDSKYIENYRKHMHVPWVDEEDQYDKLIDEINRMDFHMSGLCENCFERSSVLIFNIIMSRYECHSCMFYFRIMRKSRPQISHQGYLKSTSNQKMIAREYMRDYLADYDRLAEPSDGKAAERLGLQDIMPQVNEEDDECLFVETDILATPSESYKETSPIETDDFEDPIDENTCRMTRDFSQPEVENRMKNIGKRAAGYIPLISRKKQSKCMEENQVISECSRILRARTDHIYKSIRTKEVDAMRKFMAEMKEKTMKSNLGEDETTPVSTAALAASGASRSGKVRCDANWTEQEVKDVVKYFHWYHRGYAQISDVLMSKTPQQVKDFYLKHQEKIDESVKKYAEEIRTAHNLPPH
ncbi:unnamed protein product [Caenorhabditis nigoni]